jgi:excisionase family DNA binding protein
MRGEIGDGRRDMKTGHGETVVERLYTTKEIAEAWSVNPETVRRLAARREIRFVRIGAELRFPESAIREYLDRKTGQAA